MCRLCIQTHTLNPTLSAYLLSKQQGGFPLSDLALAHDHIVHELKHGTTHFFPLSCGHSSILLCQLHSQTAELCLLCPPGSQEQRALRVLKAIREAGTQNPSPPPVPPLPRPPPTQSPLPLLRPRPYPSHHSVCMDIARGLEYLHYRLQPRDRAPRHETGQRAPG